MHLKLTDEDSVRDALYLIKQRLRQQQIAERSVSEFITLCSELCYNAIRHGGAESELDFDLQTMSAHLYIRDSGAGFATLGEKAFVEGFSTSDSLGLGLGGVVRMADDFELETSGAGTHIRVVKRFRDG